MKEYKFGFDFKEGVYLSFDEFKLNNPAITTYQIYPKPKTSVPKKKPHFKLNKIKYKDINGNEKVKKEKNIWGLCIDNKIYICFKKELHKVLKIGAIIYFAANINEFTGVSAHGVRSVEATYQFFLDFQSGEYYSYKVKDFEQLIKRDKELYNDFLSISGKKNRKKQMLIYLDKFNDRNPIYFPSIQGDFGVNMK